MFREFPFMDHTHGVYCRHRSVQMNYQGTERKRGNVSSPEEKNTGGGVSEVLIVLSVPLLSLFARLHLGKKCLSIGFIQFHYPFQFFHEQ